MAKKEEDNKDEGFLAGMGFDFVYNTSKRIFDSFFESVSESVYFFTRRVSHFVASYILFLVGIVFLIISTILLLKQYFEITYGWSTLGFGLVLILIAFIMRAGIKKKGDI